MTNPDFPVPAGYRLHAVDAAWPAWNYVRGTSPGITLTIRKDAEVLQGRLWYAIGMVEITVGPFSWPNKNWRVLEAQMVQAVNGVQQGGQQ